MLALSYIFGKGFFLIKFVKTVLNVLKMCTIIFGKVGIGPPNFENKAERSSANSVLNKLHMTTSKH